MTRSISATGYAAAIHALIRRWGKDPRARTADMPPAVDSAYGQLAALLGPSGSDPRDEAHCLLVAAEYLVEDADALVADLTGCEGEVSSPVVEALWDAHDLVDGEE